MKGLGIIALVAPLAGCSVTPPDGLIVEVVIEDSSIDTVELIVAGACEGCAPMMGAPSVAPRTAMVFASVHDNVWFAARQGDVAGFELHADGDQDQVVSVVAVVGFDANKQAVALGIKTDVVVPAGPGEYWQVHLAPFTAIEDDGIAQPDGTKRFAAWRASDQPEPSCVMMEEWQAGKPKTVGIVPRTDPDCDHVLANECAPFTPDAIAAPATIESSSCWLPDSAIDGVCISGSSACTDGDPLRNGECIALGQDYCVPNNLCSCTSGIEGCLVNLYLDAVRTNEAPNVYCHVQVDRTTGALCPGSESTTIALGTVVGTNTTCHSMRLLVGYGYYDPAFYADQFAVGATADILMQNFRNPCTLDLLWTGTYDTPGGLFIDAQMLDVALGNGRHMMIPMRVDLAPDCATNQPPISCTVSKGTDTTERISACATTAP